ncbi:MAG: hypothetical protein ACK5TP_12585 [bacterium]
MLTHSETRVRFTRRRVVPTWRDVVVYASTQTESGTKTTIEMAWTLARRGFAVRSVEVQTPDGRCWNIATVPG